MYTISKSLYCISPCPLPVCSKPPVLPLHISFYQTDSFGSKPVSLSLIKCYLIPYEWPGSQWHAVISCQYKMSSWRSPHGIRASSTGWLHSITFTSVWLLPCWRSICCCGVLSNQMNASGLLFPLKRDMRLLMGHSVCFWSWVHSLPFH